MPTIYREVEIDIDLSEFSDDDLMDELKSRGVNINQLSEDINLLLHSLYSAWASNQKYEVDKAIRELVWEGIGRIV